MLDEEKKSEGWRLGFGGWKIQRRFPISPPDEKSTEGNQNRGPRRRCSREMQPIAIDSRIPSFPDYLRSFCDLYGVYWSSKLISYLLFFLFFPDDLFRLIVFPVLRIFYLFASLPFFRYTIYNCLSLTDSPRSTISCVLRFFFNYNLLLRDAD